MIKTKCVYDRKEPDDGKWILVMRKWPRGIPKSKIDDWHKELGPSVELLSDWKKKRIDWGEYQKRYFREMSEQKKLIEALAEKGRKEDITLVCSEKDDKYCHRRLLASVLMAEIVHGEIDRCKREIWRDSKNPSAYFSLGVLLGNLGKYEEAINSYDKVIKLNPNLVEAWTNRGVALANLGKYKEAINSCDKAIKLNPDCIEAWYDRGVALGSLGKYEEAKRSYDKVIKLNPSLVQAWVERVVTLANLGKYKEAINSCDKAIKLNPGCIEAWYNRGVALANLGKYEEAKRSYDKVIELRSDYAEVWYDRGVVLENLGKYEEAKRSYDKVIKLNPSFANAWINRGVLLRVLSGRHDEAMENFDKAIKLRPDLAEAWINQGATYFHKDEYEAAKKCLKEAMKIVSDRKAPLWNMACGLYYWTLGMETLSKRFLEDAMENFLKSASFFQKIDNKLPLSNYLFSLARLLKVSLDFKKYFKKDLSYLKIGVKKLLFDLNEIDFKRATTFIEDIVNSNRYYYSALLKSLDFEKVAPALLNNAERILARLKFEKRGQIIDRCKNFIAKIDEWKRRKGIKCIEDIPEKGQIELMNLMRDGVYAMNDFLTRVGGEIHIKAKVVNIIAEGIKLKVPAYDLLGSGKEEQLPYARMWDKETKREGVVIDKERFNQIVKDRKSYKIFIIDNGEYEMGFVGEVYFNGYEIIRSVDKTKKKKKDYLTPLEYKLLFHTLRNQYRAGSITTMVEKCWEDAETAKNLRGLLEKAKEENQNKTNFLSSSSSYRKTIANLSQFLYKKIGVELKSYRTGIFRLTSKPNFCLLQTMR